MPPVVHVPTPPGIYVVRKGHRLPVIDIRFVSREAAEKWIAEEGIPDLEVLEIK